MPVALEDVLREEAHTAGADTQGRWGKAIDVFAAQEGMLRLLFRDAVGGCVVELSQQADFTDLGLLGPLSLATEWESRKHLLTQWDMRALPSELTSYPFAKEDIVEGMEARREREHSCRVSGLLELGTGADGPHRRLCSILLGSPRVGCRSPWAFGSRTVPSTEKSGRMKP